MRTKITIQSTEEPTETYEFVGETLCQAIAKCITEEGGGVDIGEDRVANLLGTISEAILNDGHAKSWDFSSPEEGFTVCIEEIDPQPSREETLHKALSDCLDALYNETHGQDDSPWIKSVKASAAAALGIEGAK